MNHMTTPAAEPGTVTFEVVREQVMGRTLNDRPWSVYHLPAGPSQDDGWWIPIRCGGGIAMHGPLQQVPQDKVCRACLDPVAGGQC